MLVSQGIATVPRMAFVFGGRGIVRPRLPPGPVHAAPLREILRVGVPASLSTVVNYLGLMVLTSVVARFGTSHLAAYGLCTRLDFLLMSFAYGFAAAILTLVGLTTGAGRPELARRYVVRAGAFILGLISIPAAVLWLRPDLWLGLFSGDAEVHAVGALYFRIVGPTYPFVAVSMVVAFAFQGFGRATLPLVWMVVRVVGVLAVAVVATGWLGLGERTVFTAVAVANALSALVLVTLFVATERRVARAAAAMRTAAAA
jgi:Na+-driven multidrug efflux pump